MASSLSPDEIEGQNDTDTFIVQMHIVGHVDACKKKFPPDTEYFLDIKQHDLPLSSLCILLDMLIFAEKNPTRS